MRPGDGIPHWESANGTKLFRSYLIHDSVSDCWEATSPTRERASGITAEDALQNVGVLPR
jgi:hypothetical protein